MLAVVVFAAGVTLVAPLERQDNSYRIRELVAARPYGTVVMVGVERRRISAPIRGSRTVTITFKVDIGEKHLAGAGGERWAQSELSDLRQPDRGSLDDLDRLRLDDGIALDAFPIMPGGAIERGGHWSVNEGNQTCVYTLANVTSGEATIEMQSTVKTVQGTLRRANRWNLEVATGRLLRWHTTSEVTRIRGGKETVDSIGELIH